MSTDRAPAPEADTSRTKGIMALSLPLILSFWFRALTQWVDTGYASLMEGLEEASIAAIGLAAPFEFLMIACWVGASNALTSLLSKAMARDENERVEQLLAFTRRLVWGLGLLFAAVAAGIWFLSPLVLDDPAEADMLRQFQIYGTTLIAGYSITIFWSVIPDSVVKAHHDTKTTMIAGVTSTVLNLVLNTLLVFFTPLGLFGIALASVLSKFGGLAYGLWRAGILESSRLAKVTAPVAGVFERPGRQLTRLAIPAGVAFTLMAIESFAFNGILANQPNSENLLAAWTLLDRAARFLIMPVIAIGVAMLPLIARLEGFRSPERMRRELRDGQRYAAGYAILLAAPIALLLGPYVSTQWLEDPHAIELARSGMFVVPLAVLAGVPLFLMRPAFEGLQEPVPGLKLSVLRSVLLAVPLGYLGFAFGPRIGLTAMQGLLIGGAIANAVVSLLAQVWMRRLLLARYPSTYEAAPTRG